MKRTTILLMLLSISLLVLSGCQSNASTSTNMMEEVSSPSSATEDTSMQEVTGNVKEIDVTARRWEFTPNPIEVNEGDKVLLHITSTDVTHGFYLPDFGINEILPPGETVDVEFTADKKGTYLFRCSVPCGSGHMGMSGQLVVN